MANKKQRNWWGRPGRSKEEANEHRENGVP